MLVERCVVSKLNNVRSYHFYESNASKVIGELSGTGIVLSELPVVPMKILPLY